MKRQGTELIVNPRIITPNQPGSDPDQCIKRFSVLRNWISQDTIGAEIGVFKGSFLDYLLALKPTKLYAVDPWYRLYSDWGWAVEEKSTVSALIRILELFRPEIETGLLEVCVEYAAEFLGRVPPLSLDWVYIDTSHTYKQTLIEVSLARKKIKPDGLIIGDDYYEDDKHVHHGVCKALKELQSKKLIEVVDVIEKQWIAKPIFMD